MCLTLNKNKRFAKTSDSALFRFHPQVDTNAAPVKHDVDRRTNIFFNQQLHDRLRVETGKQKLHVSKLRMFLFLLILEAPVTRSHALTCSQRVSE